jgi:hypothetical protein
MYMELDRVIRLKLHGSDLKYFLFLFLKPLVDFEYQFIRKFLDSVEILFCSVFRYMFFLLGFFQLCIHVLSYLPDGYSVLLGQLAYMLNELFSALLSQRRYDGLMPNSDFMIAFSIFDIAFISQG